MKIPASSASAARNGDKATAAPSSSSSTRQSAPNGQPNNPGFDHSKYDAIGESDRMTLRFRKPG